MGWDKGFLTYGEWNLDCRRESGQWRCHEFAPGRRNVASIQVLDFDDDGVDDLLFYARNEDGAKVCYGGTFPMNCDSVAGLPQGNYFGVAWADYNGDGQLDVYLAYSQPWETGTSKLCLATGSGYQCSNFTGLDPAARSWNTDAEAFDADGDGDIDLYIEAAPQYGSDEGGLCLNQGNGTFNCSKMDLADQLYRGAPWGQTSTDITLADMDGNGRPDLVMSSRAAPYVCWNQGAGSFDCNVYLDGATAKELLKGQYPQAAVADIDGLGSHPRAAAGQLGPPGVHQEHRRAPHVDLCKRRRGAAQREHGRPRRQP